MAELADNGWIAVSKPTSPSAEYFVRGVASTFSTGGFQADTT
jgi:hypothetical protein